MFYIYNSLYLVLKKKVENRDLEKTPCRKGKQSKLPQFQIFLPPPPSPHSAKVLNGCSLKYWQHENISRYNALHNLSLNLKHKTNTMHFILGLLLIYVWMIIDPYKWSTNWEAVGWIKEYKMPWKNVQKDLNYTCLNKVFLFTVSNRFYRTLKKHWT